MFLGSLLDGHMCDWQEMRACGNIGVANEKSVPVKGVRAGGEVQCVEDRWLVHVCTDTWSGCGMGGLLCGGAKGGRVWKVGLLKITKGMCVGVGWGKTIWGKECEL